MIDGQSAVTGLYAANAARGANTTVATLPNKSVAIVDMAGTVQTSAITDTKLKVRIASKDSNGYVTYSPVFTMGTIESKTYTDYVAPTQQVTIVGYNPTTTLGAFDATVNTDYELSLDLLSTFGIYNNTPVIKQVSYATGATTSQEAIVTGLKTAWDALMAYEATPFAIMERMSNGTRAAFTAGTGDATGVKPVNGSTYVPFVKAADAAATIQTAITSGYVKLSGVTYVVTGGTTSGFTIDTPYTGTTSTIAFTDGNTGTYTSITNWGLKITGLLLPVVNPQVQDYYRVSFFTRLRKPNQGIYADSGIPIVNVTAPSDGNGTGYKLAIKEYRMNFRNTNITLSSFPTTKIKQEIVPTATYEQIVLKAYDETYTSVATGVQPKSVYDMIIAVEASLDTDVTSLKTVLGIS